MRWYCLCVFLYGLVLCADAQTASQVPLNDTFSFEDVPSDHVLKDRPLPWYLTMVQTPGTQVLIACCDTWDWLKGRVAFMHAVVRRAVVRCYMRTVRRFSLRGSTHGGA